jgi:hypothetical protein
MKQRYIVILALFSILMLTNLVSAGTIGMAIQGGNTLTNAPDYNWWFGCSPTSVGMMIGYYDKNGYSGSSFSNLVPGGVAESSSYTGGGSPLANNAIASSGHIADFYDTYGSSNDPMNSNHSFDSLADFMGTSQASLGNIDGSTTFYFFTDGSRLTAQDVFNYNVWEQDGMFGIWEYVQYAGYSADKLNFFTQKIYSTSSPNGFTFQNFKDEIDAGRVMMIHVEGHSMFGYGYEDNGLIYLNDTWTAGPHTMMWGGAYDGLEQWGVSGFTLSATSVPEPSTPLLLGLSLIGLAVFYHRASK